MKTFRILPALLVAWVSYAPAVAQRAIEKGSSDQTVYIQIVDSTDGTPETGVQASTTGLDLEYERIGQIPVDITEVDLSALTDVHTNGGLLHSGHGVYRLDIPDAAVASGSDVVVIQGTATGMVVIPHTVQLVDLDNDSLHSLLVAEFDSVIGDPGEFDLQDIGDAIQSAVDVSGVCAAGSSTTVLNVTSPTIDASNKYLGLNVRFATDTITTELQGQARRIVATANLATDTITVYPAFSTAPANSDTFVLTEGDGGTPNTGDAFANQPPNFSDFSVEATTGRVDVATFEGLDATDNLVSDTELNARTIPNTDYIQTADLQTFIPNASGTVGSGTNTASTFSVTMSPGITSNGQYVGREIQFDDDTSTSSLQNQATRIVGSVAGSPDTVTVSPALSTSPQTADAFTVLAGGGTQSASVSPMDIAGSSTTTVINLTSPALAADNAFVGSRVVFDPGTATAALRGVSVTIVDSSNDVVDTFTVYPAMPAAPTTNDIAQIESGGGATGRSDVLLVEGLDASDTLVDETEFEARTILAGSYFDPAVDPVANVTLVDTTTTNSDMRGTDSALLASSAPTNWGDLAITATTGRVTVGGLAAGTITSAAIATDAFTSDEFAATAITEIQAGLSTFDAATDPVATVTSVTNAVDVDSILGTALTETAGGNLAGTLSFFFDEATPTQTSEDVGTGLASADIRQALFEDAYDLAANASDASAFGRILDSDTDAIFDWTQATDAINERFDPGSDTVANVTTVGTLSGHTPQTGDTFAALPSNFSSLGINASGHVGRVTLVDTTTANTDMRGTDSALLAASAPTNFGDLEITLTTGQVTVGTNADKTGYSIAGAKNTLDELNDFDPALDPVANVTLVDTTTTNTDMRGTDNAFLAASAPANIGDLAITPTTGRVDTGLIEGADATDTITASATTSLNSYDGPTFDEVLGWIQLMARKDAAISTDRAAELAQINADEGSGAGTYGNQPNSLEAVRDRGDVAWTTGEGGGGGTADNRDLRFVGEPNAWKLVQRAGGIISNNTVTIYGGETKKVSFDLSGILEPGDVMNSMDATPSSNSADITPSKVGIGPTWANLDVACSSTPAATGDFLVKVTVTTENETGPLTLIGKIRVLDDPVP